MPERKDDALEYLRREGPEKVLEYVEKQALDLLRASQNARAMLEEAKATGKKVDLSASDKLASFAPLGANEIALIKMRGALGDLTTEIAGQGVLMTREDLHNRLTAMGIPDNYKAPEVVELGVEQFHLLLRLQKPFERTTGTEEPSMTSKKIVAVDLLRKPGTNIVEAVCLNGGDFFELPINLEVFDGELRVSKDQIFSPKEDYFSGLVAEINKDPRVKTLTRNVSIEN